MPDTIIADHQTDSAERTATDQGGVPLRAYKERARRTPAFGDLELPISLMAIRYATSTADYESGFHVTLFSLDGVRRTRRAADRQLRALGRLVRALAKRGVA